MAVQTKWQGTGLSVFPPSVDIAHDDVWEGVFHADLLPDGSTVPQTIAASTVTMKHLGTGADVATGVTINHTTGDGYLVRVDGPAAELVQEVAYELRVQFTNDTGRKWSWVLVFEVES
jgi:hypothetical protein